MICHQPWGIVLEMIMNIIQSVDTRSWKCSLSTAGERDIKKVRSRVWYEWKGISSKVGIFSRIIYQNRTAKSILSTIEKLKSKDNKIAKQQVSNLTSKLKPFASDTSYWCYFNSEEVCCWFFMSFCNWKLSTLPVLRTRALMLNRWASVVYFLLRTS